MVCTQGLVDRKSVDSMWSLSALIKWPSRDVRTDIDTIIRVVAGRGVLNGQKAMVKFRCYLVGEVLMYFCLSALLHSSKNPFSA